MALIGSLALSIRARTEQLKTDLQPALKAIADWGEAAKKAGADAKEVDAQMARMRKEAYELGRTGKDSGVSLQQGLSKAKVAASALTGAISAMSSEMGGAVGHATRLGTSLISSFLAGGPVALGITAITAGIAALAGASKEAQEEINRVREEAEKAGKAARDSLLSEGEQRARLRDQLAEKRGQVNPGFASEQALRRELKGRLAVLEDGISEERRKIEKWSAERATLRVEMLKQTFGESGANEETAKRDALIEAAREAISLKEQAAASARETAKLDLEAANLARTQADQQERQEAALKRIKGIVGGIGQDFEGVTKSLHAQAEAAKDVEKSLGRARGIAKSLNEAADDYAAAQQKAADKQQAAVLKSGDDMLLRLGRKLTEAAEARARAEEKQQAAASKAEREQTALAMKRAEEEAKVTEEKRKQAAEVQKQLDITKRFANFGGAAGGTFGFGAGTIGGAWGPGGSNVKKKGGPAGAAGGQGAAAIFNLPDLGPSYKALETELAKIPPWIERLVSSQGELGAAAQRAVERVGKAAAKGLSSNTSRIKALEGKAEALERDIVRAAGADQVGG